MAQKQAGKGTMILAYFSLAIVVLGLGIKCKKSFDDDPESAASENPFTCGVMDKWSSDDDVINALQGTWVMENEDYYGKYKIQFSGHGGSIWKMDAGGTDWIDKGTVSLSEIKKYDNATKMNQGAEYYITYDVNVGSMSFDINCISGLTIASDRYPEYGIAFVKQ